MAEGYLALDVGGSSLKAAALDAACQPLPGSVRQYALPQPASREEILGLFYRALQEARHSAQAAGISPAALGAGFPGPFDFDKGLSLMSHKLPAIKGLPLRELLSGAAGGLPVHFLHDSTAYMLGEAHQGAAAGALSPACLMLGTGLGFAHMLKGRVCVGEDRRPHAVLWRLPFLDGTAEDYVSRAAIRQRYGALSGMTEPPDVEAIALLARQGDEAAISCFDKTARLLAQLLRPLLDSLGCDLLVLGGQIARSADLFIDHLRQGLSLPVLQAAHFDDAALRGAGHYCLQPGEGSEVQRPRSAITGY